MNDASTVNPNITLANLGLDSLMTVELRQTLLQNYDISVSLDEIRALTFAKLDQMSAHTSPGDAASEQPAAASVSYS